MAYRSFPIRTAMLTIFTLVVAAAGNGNYPTNTSPPTSFYDVLESNGLPIGLFPKGISDFSVDPVSARFELHLVSPSPCNTKFETRVRYEWNMTGSLNYGKIANLSGVAAQELFLWLPVKSIQVDIPSSGLIYFDVGGVFKQFSLSFFETPKDCDALAKEGGMIMLDNFPWRLIEDQFGRFVRRHFTDQEHRTFE